MLFGNSESEALRSPHARSSAAAPRRRLVLARLRGITAQRLPRCSNARVAAKHTGDETVPFRLCTFPLVQAATLAASRPSGSRSPVHTPSTTFTTGRTRRHAAHGRDKAQTEAKARKHPSRRLLPLSRAAPRPPPAAAERATLSLPRGHAPTPARPRHARGRQLLNIRGQAHKHSLCPCSQGCGPAARCGAFIPSAAGRHHSPLP